MPSVRWRVLQIPWVASMRRCAMLSTPFGCLVFDLGHVGTYRAASNSFQQQYILQYAL
jgi:hypothetical protein